jgi:hypothetical protein
VFLTRNLKTLSTGISTEGGISMRKLMFHTLAAAALLLPSGAVFAETTADQAMAQEIGQRLKDSGRLKNYRIGVKYEDGVAWLSGTTATAIQRDEAVRLTKEMPGISHVVNRLEVAGAPVASEGNVAAAFINEENVPAPAMAAPMQRQPVAPIGQNQYAAARSNMPVPAGMMARQASYQAPPEAMQAYEGPTGGAVAGSPAAFAPGGARAASYDNAQMPGYAWPSYAAYPNYAAVTYPQQYSPTAWPYIGPFYPYPQVPLAWRKVSLEWDDGWWFLDFSAHNSSH